jgi:hypothetical protein
VVFAVLHLVNPVVRSPHHLAFVVLLVNPVVWFRLNLRSPRHLANLSV